MSFIHSLQSEMLKTRRTAAIWMSFIGGFFIPIIYVMYSTYKKESINSLIGSGMNIWRRHFGWNWENMAPFLLPAGIIMASSLITQMEYKNNTWKQLHTTPQSYTTVFLAKFSAILILTFQFFLFFNIGIILSGVISCLIVDGKMPEESIPVWYYLKENLKYFIACLPILAIQYLISLRFKNFLVSIGVGLIMLIGTLIAAPWQHVYTSPYSYPIIRLMPGREFPTGLSPHVMAILYFFLLMAISFLIYIRRKEKG